METLNTWIRGIVTGAVLLITAWWLLEVSSRLGTPATVNQSGDVIVDEFQNAKDILLVVLPLSTTAIGYWFGVQGKEKAEERAEEAKNETDKAKKETRAIVAVAQDPDLLNRARETYPEAFGDR